MSKKLLFISILLITSIMNGLAKEVHWTGGQGDRKWESPGNWKDGLVPTENDDVFISDEEVLYRGKSIVRSLTLIDGAVLVILDGKTLIIEAAPASGILLENSEILIQDGSVAVLHSLKDAIVLNNDSFISNKDSLKIIGSQGAGLILSESFVENDGVLLIDTTAKEGVVIEGGGGLKNEAIVEIRNTIGHGLYNKADGVFENDLGASFKIHSIANLLPVIGILNIGVMINHGSLELYDLLCPAIYSIETSASITNHGFLSMENTLFGLFTQNGSLFVNESGSIISMRNMERAMGLNGPFQNSGKIQIDSSGAGVEIFAGNDFINFDTIIVEHSSKEAINLYGKLDNRGYIELSHSDSHGIWFRNGDTLINTGTIYMNNNGEDAFLNEGYIENHSKITIHQAGNVGLLHEGDGVLENKMGAQIIITEPSAQGLENLAIINNHGGISISGSELQGIYNYGEFNNYNNISINSSSSIAIYNRGNVHSFEEGIIRIYDSSSDGIENNTNASFINEGDITLFRTSGDAISNRGFFTQFSSGILQTFSTLGSSFLVYTGADTDILGEVLLDDGSGGN